MRKWGATFVCIIIDRKSHIYRYNM